MWLECRRASAIGADAEPETKGSPVRTSTLILFAALPVVLFAACGASASGLTGREWRLTAITEKVPAHQGVVLPAEL